MHTISSSELKQSFGATLDAAQRGPVVIKKHDRDVAVLISMDEFDKLRGLRVEEFERLARELSAEASRRGLTDEDLDRILADVS